MRGKAGQTENSVRSSEFSVDFKLPKDLLEAIETEFGFALTAVEVAKLEAIAGEAIGYRRSFPKGPTFEGYRDQSARTKRRREQIVRAVDKLRRLLDADESADQVWRLNIGTFDTRRNALDASIDAHGRCPSVRDQVAPTLEFVKGLALQPHLLEKAFLRKVSKRGRHKTADSDAFEPLIRTVIEIFLERGVPPTANHNQKTRGHNSPLLRGLKKLHDALPRDVHAQSFAGLGGPTAEWIKRYNRNKPRIGAVNRVPIRNRGKIRRAA
jgi:hypothetical protein